MPRSAHSEGLKAGNAAQLFKNPSFLLLAFALFMYVGAEVSVGKWVVTFMQRDPAILASQGVDEATLKLLSSTADESVSRFFEADSVGYAVATYSYTTLTLFAMALLLGRLVSSILLGVFRFNSFLLITLGSLLTVASLLIAFNSSSALTVRIGLIAAGFGMGPIFPTSVGLASVMMPKLAGTAMSLVMGVGFAGLLVIPPAVGYVSSAVGGPAGNVRSGLTVVIAASIIMLVLHIVLVLRERTAIKTS
jgi:FHS family L-fucose permease-like MFS transporter